MQQQVPADRCSATRLLRGDRKKQRLRGAAEQHAHTCSGRMHYLLMTHVHAVLLLVLAHAGGATQGGGAGTSESSRAGRSSSQCDRQGWTQCSSRGAQSKTEATGGTHTQLRQPPPVHCRCFALLGTPCVCACLRVFWGGYTPWLLTAFPYRQWFPATAAAQVSLLKTGVFRRSGRPYGLCKQQHSCNPDAPCGVAHLHVPCDLCWPCLACDCCCRPRTSRQRFKSRCSSEQPKQLCGSSAPRPASIGETKAARMATQTAAASTTSSSSGRSRKAGAAALVEPKQQQEGGRLRAGSLMAAAVKRRFAGAMWQSEKSPASCESRYLLECRCRQSLLCVWFAPLRARACMQVGCSACLLQSGSRSMQRGRYAAPSSCL